MSIKKAILCAGITVVLVYMAVGSIVMWNSVDYDQYEEDEDEELSTDKLSFEELKETRGMFVCCYKNTEYIAKTEETKVSDTYWADSLIFTNEAGAGCGVLLSQETPVTSAGFPGKYTVYSEYLGLESKFEIPAAGTFQKLIWDYKAGSFEVMPSIEEEARKYFRKDN